MAFKLVSSASQHSVPPLATDSPPPLVFSDASSEDLNDDFEVIMDKQDVSAVMTKVLSHLESIAEHLREKGENDAANEIAKQAISIVNIFTDVTASWDISKCLMKAPSRYPDLTTTRGNANTGKPTSEGTWAAIAAKRTEQNNRLVKYHPSDAVKKTVVQDSNGLEPADLRVVWIQPWVATAPLTEVTKHLTNYGALLSVAFSEADRAVCVIFQHAYQAQALLEDNEESVKMTGRGLCGPHSHMLLGQAYPKNDDLRRMEPPVNERRRLTFARQALFTVTNGLSEDQFKKDIYAIVGERNVELVWLFNSGNATVVFTATPIARLVRDEFRQRGRKGGPYQGVQVSFSHDPCERPLHLVTQMPNGGATAQQSNHGNPNYAPLGQGTTTRRFSAGGTTPGVDEDGWQTVQRRR